MHFCGIEDGETSVFISSFNCIMLVLSDSLSSHTYSSSIEASFVCIPFTLWAYMCIDPLFIQKGWLNFTFNRVGFIHLGYRVFSLFKLPSTITMLHCVDNYNSRRISCVHNNVSRCIECIGKNHQFGTRCASVLKVCRAETEPSLM